jgi:23S rRNA A2030 N6-methylase RlmJ
VTPVAYYNSSKLCWEIWIEEAQGDRMARVLKHAQTAHKVLKEQGYKFVDAKLGNMAMPILLITDPAYYLDNETDIIDWCVQSSVQCKQTGMILEFGSQEEKMMFLLRWS